jgi:hypothetical protein
MLESHILQLLIPEHLQRHLKPFSLLTEEISLAPLRVSILALSSSRDRWRLTIRHL